MDVKLSATSHEDVVDVEDDGDEDVQAPGDQDSKPFQQCTSYIWFHEISIIQIAVVVDELQVKYKRHSNDVPHNLVCLRFK